MISVCSGFQAEQILRSLMVRRGDLSRGTHSSQKRCLGNEPFIVKLPEETLQAAWREFVLTHKLCIGHFIDKLFHHIPCVNGDFFGFFGLENHGEVLGRHPHSSSKRPAEDPSLAKQFLVQSLQSSWG